MFSSPHPLHIWHIGLSAPASLSVSLLNPLTLLLPLYLFLSMVFHTPGLPYVSLDTLRMLATLLTTWLDSGGSIPKANFPQNPERNGNASQNLPLGINCQ